MGIERIIKEANNRQEERIISLESRWESEWREYEEKYLGRAEKNRDNLLEAPIYQPKGILHILQNKLNHYKNLHGLGKCEGLTGRWRGVFYYKGEPRLKHG